MVLICSDPIADLLFQLYSMTIVIYTYNDFS